MKKDKMKDRKTVVLIGFMGSGKTTIGIRLSYLLRIPVEDTDKWIEQKNGCSISEIFEKQGEEAFRQKETELLREWAGSDHSRVLSVGGGTPLREENRELLKKCGTVVYLRVQPETVYQRLKGDTTRPLLQCEDPLGRIRELLLAREEKYAECADIIIDVDELAEAECARVIVEKMGERE